MSRSAQLRRMLSDGECLLAPGAYDGLTARLIELAGFKTVYATGAGISNSQFALADVGLVTMNEILEQCRRMIASTELPVICDIDNGYGNAVNLHRTVGEFVRAGAAAVQVEDQVFPKKCGHFSGKQILPFDESVAKIGAAVDARGSSDMLIVARTDAIAVAGFDEAIRRANAFSQAGADVIFVEAPRNIDEIREISRNVSAPKVANIVEGGRTPLVPLADLKSMGFQIVLYANLVLRSSVKAVQASLAHLAEHGDSTGILDSIITMDERAHVTRKDYLDDLERRFAVRSGAVGE